MRRLFGALPIGVILATLLLPGVALAGDPAMSGSSPTAAASAERHHWPHTITLPGASSTEGIARGRGNTFYAGDLFQGDIFRGNVRTGTVTKFIDAPAGRNATGMKVDLKHKLLFVSGGPTGQAYVYDLRTGATVASFQLGAAGSSFINDVIIARGAAWFTDSLQPHLYKVPIHRNGTVGAASTLVVTGPAAHLTGAFNLNGIAAARGGRVLLVAHSGDGTIYRVDPKTGASAPIAGANVPNVDGILYERGRLWAVQNANNQITELRLWDHLTRATVRKVITDPAFEFPTTVARFGHRLAAVNAKFDTGFPPTATTFEVVVVRR